MSRRGLLLDLDGTLADSMPLMRRLYGDFVTEQGGTPSDEEFHSYSGIPLRGIMVGLQQTHGFGGDPDAHVAAYLERVHEHYGQVDPIPGARELFTAAREAGFRIAVVTSSSAGLARRWTEGVDLAVDAIVGCEDVVVGKPDPEPFLLGLERLACDAATSLAVEDAPLGARSAVDAGIPTFVRGTPTNTPWPPVEAFIPRLDTLIPHLTPPDPIEPGSIASI